MSDFFRFPHTPHIAWLGENAPREDKVLSSSEAAEMLAGYVVVEEKLDGANLGLSLSPDGRLRAQNRGQYLAEPHVGQFARLPGWMMLHGDSLRKVLTPNLILFGEWCAARHSLRYDSLPDWFLLFDVYDRSTGRFWSSALRDVLANNCGLTTVPQLLHGVVTLFDLKRIAETSASQYGNGALEGVVVRRETAEWCVERAKLVRPDFTQAIDTHWRKRVIEWNRIAYSERRKE